MVAISILITESSEQIVSGIPRSVSISTNISSTIFYTLDGTDPTLFSSIYTSALMLPTDQLVLILKVFATNGSDTSPIISETYETNILNNARLPHSATDAAADSTLKDLYPFGTNPIQPQSSFLNPGEAGININDPDLPTISSGFDGAGNPTGKTNLPYSFDNYNIVYPRSNAQGETPIGVGNLPSKITVNHISDPPEESKSYDKLFDPRALVIFQDASKEDPSLPPHINRASFSLENSEKARTGNNFFTSGLDSQPNTGTFLRSHYNPRDNTITYYYLDNISNKWIISKTPYQPKSPDAGNLYGMVLSKNKGAGMVFGWYPFNRRYLY